MAPETGPEPSPELLAEHTPERVRARLAEGPDRSYLRDGVYGAVDGAVTTFAVVTGALGAQLAAGIVLILGFANLAADGLSMAVGNVLGTRSEVKQLERARRHERRHIDLIPEGEREEVRQLLATKGFEGTVLEEAVDAITADPDRWVDFMLTEEYGFSLNPPSPLRAGTVTFGSFVAAGLVPLLPFVAAELGVALASPITWSAWLTGATFAFVGVLRARFVDESMVRSALETVALGGVAAAAAFFVGVGLRGLAGG